MSKPFANYLNRIDVVKKNIETLLKANKELAEANDKLRQQIQGLEMLAAARERVLKSFEEQVRREDL